MINDVMEWKLISNSLSELADLLGHKYQGIERCEKNKALVGYTHYTLLASSHGQSITSSVVSVCLLVSPQLSRWRALKRFSLNYIFETFNKTYQQNWDFSSDMITITYTWYKNLYTYFYELSPRLVFTIRVLFSLRYVHRTRNGFSVWESSLLCNS
jgi:hypothetical protein